MIDVKLVNGREANRRSKAVSSPRSAEIAMQVVDLFGEDACPSIVADGDDTFRVYYWREVTSETKRRDAAAGQTWDVRVSGNVVTVKLTWVGRREAGGFHKVARPWFRGTNLRTGRYIEGHRARLRRRVG